MACIAGAFVLSACGGAQISATVTPITSGNTTTSASATTTPAQPANAASDGGTGTQQTSDNGAQPVVSSNPSNCKSSELKLSFGHDSDHAMQKTYTSIQFTNTGQRTCTLQGFPGVSFVTGDNGQQVGQAANRSGNQGPAITLRPGSSTNAGLIIVNADPFPADQCKPVDVRGLRVYPPNETAAMFLPSSGRGCAGSVGPLLTVSSVGTSITS
ncbi:secreted lipoprotein [Kutzneria sp. 744]|nr:secreted lipoprotein [Kutzneria sp. 744]